MDAIEMSGFSGQFEYMLLPMKKNGRQNKGHAFVYFLDQRDARAFQFHMDGRRVREKSEKCIATSCWEGHYSLEEVLAWDETARLFHRRSRFGVVMMSVETSLQ
jgi:hypothetical protein